MTNGEKGKVIKSLKVGDVLNLKPSGLRVIVTDKPETCNEFGCYCGGAMVHTRTEDGEYEEVTCKNDFTVSKKRGVVVNKERSDGYIFSVLAFSKKKMAVSAGCRELPSVEAALDYWHDDYKVNLENERIFGDRRLKLNQESRKLVTTLAARALKKLESAAPSEARKVAKKKKSVKKKSRG